METRIRRFCCPIALVCALLCTLFFLPVSAASGGHSWYCAHVKDHARPELPRGMDFIRTMDGYFIDERPAVAAGEDRVVYLTFDAGYENGNVARVLDALRDKDVPAAFFILSHLVESDAALVERMFREGHAVCNHTAHHKDMSKLEGENFLSELRALEDTVRETLGRELSPYYRPPEGRFSKENLALAQGAGYKTVFWSFAYPDWDNDRQPPAEGAVRTILENLHSGEVLLLHPTSATNATILPRVIDAIRAEGYRFGTLDELTGGLT